MSEAQDLNDGSFLPDPTGAEPADIETEALLRSLVPRQPTINRDLLFFEAGLAAAGPGNGQRRLSRAVWPAVAATLLVACGALAIALERKSTALDAALANVATRSATAIASTGTPAGQGIVEHETGSNKNRSIEAARLASPSVESGRLGTLSPSGRLEQVMSIDRVPGRQLTAHGWIEAPPGSPTWQIESTPPPGTEPVDRPIRLPTYLELLRAEQG
ncbi:MAG TPA: hypothetical protein VGG30_05300 [Pirellulales bacterium]|jgi:hypothetical protein